MSDKKCDCRSYNLTVGSTPEVILMPPDWSDKQDVGICVDACIADVVQEIWRIGLITLGSCCGHNRYSPSIIIPEDCDIYTYFDVIEGLDNRKWSVQRWENVLRTYYRGSLCDPLLEEVNDKE